MGEDIRCRPVSGRVHEVIHEKEWYRVGDNPSSLEKRDGVFFTHFYISIKKIDARDVQGIKFRRMRNMMNYKKYVRQYFMPPVKCMKWAEKEYVEKGPARRRVLAAHLGFAFCFAALYLFHLILYNYNFSDIEGLALKDYDRYLAPYYQAWMLAMLCLLARSAKEQLGQLALGGAAAVIMAVFCWRGIPAAGFWTGANSLYTLRADVQNRADTMNTVLNWPDRVLVISQGDDATRWYYYRYELTAQVVNGFGGFYGRLGETQDRWDSDFMNLVESENWTLYDYKAVCVPDTLVAYMAEKDCDYILIDRADDYLQREFSPLFEGGLTNDMPATLYHFEGADADVPFTLAAVAESGVA